MFKVKTRGKIKEIVMVSTACTMLSMYGAPISSTEAATRSHTPSVYVTPQNTAASDIISIDWSPVQTAPYTY
ncbi:chitin-binding protein, partial [Bacillus cereus]|nr:chitin-binding protein [Bacillus cereus]